mmetsp:Transcript_92701/g.288549  ORF Transcript_92701/g.288549 Transcript_92701/m.288549 type:complete len:611 (+) Transcript_92701:2-1834(+)
MGEDRITLRLQADYDFGPDPVGTCWRIDACDANFTAYLRQMKALTILATTPEEERPPLCRLLTVTSVGGSNVDEWGISMRARLDKRHKEALEASAADDTEGASEEEAKEAKEAEDPEDLEDPEGTDDLERAAEERLRQLAAEEPKLSAEQAAELKRLRKSLRSPDGDGGLCSDGLRLNASQRNTIAAALNRRLTLVQGPPGTGKTRVCVQMLRLWTQRLRVGRVLATSESNIAVDNIAEEALRCGLRVVRLGRPERINSHLEGICLTRLLAERRGCQVEDPGFVDAVMSRIHVEDAKLEEERAKRSIVLDAEVICMTTAASAADLLNDMDFGAILIDEVAQATEISALVPLALRRAERLVLVGDHCQLPPCCQCLEAQCRGMTLSLFGRLISQGVRPMFLDTQFRMHPALAAYSSQAFYQGQLKTGVSPEERPPPAGFEWPLPSAGIAFIHTDSPQLADYLSYRNQEEVEIVLDILASVLTAGELTEADIGVISPYKAQVLALRKELHRILLLMTGGRRRRITYELDVASVDSFQGREKELIVFSAVRSNPHGNVGFLDDWRRLNVMISRARRGLIVVGNLNTLRANQSWGSWIDWAEKRGYVCARKQAA